VSTEAGGRSRVACGVTGALGELLRAKALRRCRIEEHPSKDIGTRIRLPESTTDDDMLDSHARRFVSNGGDRIRDLLLPTGSSVEERLVISIWRGIPICV